MEKWLFGKSVVVDLSLGGKAKADRGKGKEGNKKSAGVGGMGMLG